MRGVNGCVWLSHDWCRKEEGEVWNIRHDRAEKIDRILYFSGSKMRGSSVVVFIVVSIGDGTGWEELMPVGLVP